VTKPFIPEELVARLKAVISRSTNTRDLNPLTGMSGNTDILREINQRLKANERFAVLYPDIDTFKSYNDHYGFLRGDDVIKTLGTIILEVLEAHYSSHHFGGHVGGDDFVILTEPAIAETIAAEITRRFDEAVPDLYDEADRERGWIEYEDRSGTTLKTGLLLVSIGSSGGAWQLRSAAALASRATGQGRRQENAGVEVGRRSEARPGSSRRKDALMCWNAAAPMLASNQSSLSDAAHE
jgi:diguanylate cyclase (GGDEF)-like protein